jgi:hypothetical protein
VWLAKELRVKIGSDLIEFLLGRSISDKENNTCKTKPRAQAPNPVGHNAWGQGGEEVVDGVE